MLMEPGGVGDLEDGAGVGDLLDRGVLGERVREERNCVDLERLIKYLGEEIHQERRDTALVEFVGLQSQSSRI